MTKRIAKPKHLVAQSITLKDDQGKTRIFMAAHDGGKGSTICLLGDRDRAIELQINPEGGLHLSFHAENGKLSAGLSITANDQVGLFLNDSRTGTRAELGTTSPDGSSQLNLYHLGKRVWSTEKAPKRRKKK